MSLHTLLGIQILETLTITSLQGKKVYTLFYTHYNDFR